MAEFPALPLWTDSYLADTGHLTTLEHGAYLLLLFTMWRNGGALPNDDRKLARFARLTDAQWARIRPNMMEFFTISSDKISQSRLTDELVAVRQRSKRQSENARSKSRKDKENNAAKAEPKYDLAEPIGSQTAASIPIPISSLRSDTKEPPSESPKSTQKKGCRIPDNFEPDYDFVFNLASEESVSIQMPSALSWFAEFRDYWVGVAGAKGIKLDWQATWRNHARKKIEFLKNKRTSSRYNAEPQRHPVIEEVERRKEMRNATADNFRTIDHDDRQTVCGGSDIENLLSAPFGQRDEPF